MRQVRYIQNIFLTFSRYSWRYFLPTLLLIINSLLHLNSLSESYRRQQKAHRRNRKEISRTCESRAIATSRQRVASRVNHFGDIWPYQANL